MSLSAIQSFTPLRTEPLDFQVFWDNTRNELSAIDPAPRPCAYEKTSASFGSREIVFSSLDDVEISGYLLEQPKPAPLIVHTHGYNDQYEHMYSWADCGYHVMGLDLRGFGRSHYKVHQDGYILTGLDSPEHSILRGAVCDVMQALEAGTQILAGRVTQTVLYGFSFGGAMAVMAGALSVLPNLVVVGQPTLGWHSERRRVSLAGSTQELNRHLSKHPEHERQAKETLSYFDTLHFAARVSKPVFMGVGLDDDVVPSRTVLAIFNHLGSPQKELRLLPVAHSHDPRESLWQRFDQEWLTLAQGDITQTFGSPERQINTIMASDDADS